MVLCAMPFPFAGKRMTVKDRDRAADIQAIQEGLSGEASEAGERGEPSRAETRRDDV